MTSISFDTYQTLAIAVIATSLGYRIKKHIRALERFCIPAPVIGGIVVATIVCILHETGMVEVVFDASLRDVCMVFFFTSVGFQADFKVLRSGGKSLGIFLILVVVLVFLQNTVAIGSAMLFGMDKLLGLCIGSIPMTGGHGTSVAFGPILEEYGLAGASSLCIAGATYGLIAGSIIGGPIANSLIVRKNLLSTASSEDPYKDSVIVKSTHDSIFGYSIPAFQMAVAAGIGSALSML